MGLGMTVITLVALLSALPYDHFHAVLGLIGDLARLALMAYVVRTLAGEK